MKPRSRFHPSVVVLASLNAAICWGQSPGAIGSTDAERIAALEEKVFELQLEAESAREKRVVPESRVDLTGYADLGFYVPQGTGSGVAQDLGNTALPQYRGQYAWVFWGDLLAPAINSRGEVADLGDLPAVNRYDPIHSRGALGFLVNEMSLGIKASLGERVLFTGQLNFAPRSGSNFGLGDVFDAGLVQLEWAPFRSGKTSIFIGKMDSVIGIEYRDRRAVDRFGITPSLLARYTTGTPIGLKVRTKFFDDRLVVALALSNGSSGIERFHFYDEIDSNSGKNVSGRVSFRLPFPGSLEVGASGMYGPQDKVSDNSKIFWLWGVDAMFELGDLQIKAQLLSAHADGASGEDAYALQLRPSAYLEVDYMVTPWFGVMLRGEFRDALVVLGTERLYVTRSYRATAGLRAVLRNNLFLKVEYLKNGEYGGLPEIRNDIFTSSLVVAY